MNSHVHAYIIGMVVGYLGMSMLSMTPNVMLVAVVVVAVMDVVIDGWLME